MSNPLFSTYRGGENRVTSSTMAVFERIDLALVKELLQSAGGIGDELRAVTFDNQVAAGGEGGVPDARISGNFTWWFETKTYRNGYDGEGHDRDQLRAHANRLTDDPGAFLFVLTPDPVQPRWLSEPDGVEESVWPRVVWVSFAALADVIRDMLGDASRLASEQVRFLLAELVALYEAEGLLSDDDTVVVAARQAWGEYLNYGVYICQADRSFREGITHFGFYYQGKVMDRVARIRAYHPNVTFSMDSADAWERDGQEEIAGIVRLALERRIREDGEVYGVMLLSGPDAAETLRLGQPIDNDTTTAKGKPWAWTLGQRYTRLERLTSGVRWTSQL
jgi:hypothetical protein